MTSRIQRCIYIANRDKLDVRNEMPGTETSSGAGED